MISRYLVEYQDKNAGRMIGVFQDLVKAIEFAQRSLAAKQVAKNTLTIQQCTYSYRESDLVKMNRIERGCFEFHLADKPHISAKHVWCETIDNVGQLEVLKMKLDVAS